MKFEMSDNQRFCLTPKLVSCNVRTFEPKLTQTILRSASTVKFTTFILFCRNLCQFKREFLVMSGGNTGESTQAGVSKAEAGLELDDKAIVCIDCAQEFVWSAGEQAFFRDKNLENPPKRCKPCKRMKNDRLSAIETAQITGKRMKIEVSAQCAKCGAVTTVPFYPSQGRPVYCRACYLELSSPPDAEAPSS